MTSTASRVLHPTQVRLTQRQEDMLGILLTVV